MSHQVRDLGDIFHDIHQKLFLLKENDSNPTNDPIWRELHILVSEADKRSKDLVEEVEPLEMIEEVGD